MKKLLLLLCFVFIHQVVYPVYFKHLGMSDGLSQVSVMSIYQDCLGRMWFGTREGVSIYDGERMRVYKGWENLDPESSINVYSDMNVIILLETGKGIFSLGLAIRW